MTVQCNKSMNECMWCGDRFKPTKKMHHQTGYCSEKCYLTAKNKISVCEVCGKQYRRDTNTKTCSRQCRLKKRAAANRQRAKEQLEKRIHRTCIKCGKSFTTTQKQNRQYCSLNCKTEHCRGPNSPSWKGGISFVPYCEKFNSEFKERVRAYYNYECFECGISQDENGRSLDVHHVTYDKEVCCNDKTPLFVALCRGCHIKTNHNREQWEAYFTKRIYDELLGKCFYSKQEFEQLGR